MHGHNTFLPKDKKIMVFALMQARWKGRGGRKREREERLRPIIQ